jgi:hypothetical protein
MVRENSGRAVRKEVPIDYEQARAKWVRVVASCLPQFGSFQYGQLGSAGGVGGLGEAANRRQDGGGRGGKGAGRGGATGGGGLLTPARYNGIPVCFKYNNKEGCNREPQGKMACKEGGNVYAHVCNFKFRANGTQTERSLSAA